MMFRYVFFCFLCFLTVAAVDPFYKPVPPEKVIITQWVPCKNSNVEEVVSWLKKQTELIDGVKVGFDPMTHQVWLKGEKKNVTAVKKIVQAHDKKTPQIYIVAKIVTMSKNYRRQLGFQWQTTKQSSQRLGGLQMNFPTDSHQNNQFTVSIADLGFGRLLDLTLQAMEHEGNGQVIASPQLLIADKKTASSA